MLIFFYILLTGQAIRLVPPPDATHVGQGRVEVKHEGTWGTVCDDEWSIEDATVVCEQMGFLKAIYQARQLNYGRGGGGVEGWTITKGKTSGRAENGNNRAGAFYYPLLCFTLKKFLRRLLLTKKKSTTLR